MGVKRRQRQPSAIRKAVFHLEGAGMLIIKDGVFSNVPTVRINVFEELPNLGIVDSVETSVGGM